MQSTRSPRLATLPKWSLALFPLLLLALLIFAFQALNPLAFFSGAFPPIEELAIQQVRFPGRDQIELSVVNGGPDEITIAQVIVDDAYWQYEMEPRSPLGRLGRATIRLAYPWVDGEPLVIRLITATGITFDAEVDVAVTSPQTESGTFAAYGLLGIYVGVIPVGLGMLWYPFMRRADQKWTAAFLALTVGLLMFLFVDTLLEALEIASELPGVLQGVPLVFLVTLLALGLLLIAGRRGGDKSPYSVASLIALGIGLHNMGEGLAIGAAFAAGAAALGSFLVIGFTLHNITEGVGIAAPLLRQETTSLARFVKLALLAGAPAIVGTWIGGFAFDPLLAVIFLSLGAGAILQVILEVSRLLVREGQRHQQGAYSWLNFGAATAGILVMYLTAFLVKF